MEAVNKACSAFSCVEHGVAVALERWGRLVARNPWKVSTLSLRLPQPPLPAACALRSRT